jgi:predicted deacetylase
MSGAHAPLCIELHDVAPATWPLCSRLLEMVDAVGPMPVSLLVVPDFHRRGRVTQDARFLRAMEARLARGDEIALHGLHHLDEGPVSRTPAEWLRRRVRTLSEGEFAATDATISAERIAIGLAEFVAAGWRVHGFVPPAWLLGNGARRALDGFGFSYVAMREAFFALPQWRAIPTTTLSYAAFSAWRRALSRPVLDVLLRRAAPERPLRLALHPVDARFDAVVAHWRSIVVRATREREPLTAARIVELCRDDRGRRAGRTRGSKKRGRAGVASRP